MTTSIIIVLDKQYIFSWFRRIREFNFLIRLIFYSNQFSNQVTEYQVKWAGYDDPDDNTWEPLKNLTSCQKKIDEFDESHPEAADGAAGISKQRFIHKDHTLPLFYDTCRSQSCGVQDEAARSS